VKCQTARYTSVRQKNYPQGTKQFRYEPVKVRSGPLLVTKEGVIMMGKSSVGIGLYETIIVIKHESASLNIICYHIGTLFMYCIWYDGV